MQTTRDQLAQQSSKEEKQVWAALANLERDMQLLDTLTGQRPQLRPLELALLTGSVLAALSGPALVGGHITGFIAPASAAFSAAIGIGAEYVGKVAVADGKEVAAATIQCAAESEALLANAERAKAITPLCVGVATTAASFALLVPVLLDTIVQSNNMQFITEVYLFCPLVAVFAAAVAALALQETRSFCASATSVGNRRFAKRGLVGRSWLSSTELIGRKSQGSIQKWQTFCLSVLPAPILGSFVPGGLPTKTIVVSSLAAAQCAYFVAQSEYALSRATDAVALKSRSAAVCDTYANQGARSAAILPFTSALSGLCAAATAAVVELPFLETASLLPKMIGVTIFPACSALLAAAASVSKARCEVDTEAAMQAASTMALEYNDGDGDEDNPVLSPFRGVQELVKIMVQSSVWEPLRRRLKGSWFWKMVVGALAKRRNETKQKEEDDKSVKKSTNATVSQ